MNTDWIKTTIGEQATLQRGFDITRREQNPGQIPVISSSGISSYHDIAVVKGPGVIIGRKGSLGTVFYVEEDYWPHDTTLWVKDFHSNNPKFVYYFFKLLKVIHLDAGTANPTLNRNHVHPIQVLWPPLSEQQAIAHILGSLDDKIELNRQMNETLEAIAHALFKSWFVDFDPVQAKMEGRQPYGMDAETAALFPDGFEDSALGEIPRGWKIGNPQDIADITMGQSPPGEAYNELGDGLPFYQGIRDFGFRFPSRRVYCNTAGRMAEKGDVLLSVRAPVGSLNIALERSIIGRGLAALRAKSKKSSFLYYLLNEIQPAWDMFNASGTVFGSVSRADIQKLSIKLPPIEIELRFNSLVESIDCRIELNENETATLAALRDTLLPKLLSGELRVGEAEKEVGAML